MNKLEKVLAENTIDGGFLQSEHWARFKKKSGAEVFEFGDGKSFRALVVEHELPLVGKYLYCPRGPVLVQSACTRLTGAKFKVQSDSSKFKVQSDSSKHKVKNFLEEILNKAKKNKIGWVRVEPHKEEDLEVIRDVLTHCKDLPLIPSLVRRGEVLVKAKKNHQPAQTVMVDLTGSEEEILMSMKHKTRYNIRLSERKGVEVFEAKPPQSPLKEGGGSEDIEKFCDLLDETAKRDKITNHPHKHYFDLLEKIDESVTKLYLAKYENKILSGAMVSFYGRVATYLHGASSNEDRNVMSPFTLHWKIIQEAKKMGMKKYDLGGTRLTPGNRKSEIGNRKKETKSNHQSSIKNQKSGGWVPAKGSWKGITRFKQGFCPNEDPVDFPGCWDIILNPTRYKLYKFLQSLKDLR